MCSIRKHFIICCLLVGFAKGAFAQNLSKSIKLTSNKPSLNTSIINKWLSVGFPDNSKTPISNDGNYAFYSIREHYTLPTTLIIQSLKGAWKMELKNAENVVFTEDSRMVVCVKSSDTLCLITLGSFAITYIPDVNSFKLFKQGKSEWMVYHLKALKKDLILVNLATGKVQSFSDVSEYLISQDGNILVLKTELIKNTTVIRSLNWVNLINSDEKVIWKATNTFNLILASLGNLLAFLVEKKIDDHLEKTIWIYDSASEKTFQLANNQSSRIDTGFIINGIENFSADGSRLFISLKEKEHLKPKPDAVKVDVWSYTDAKLQSQQLIERGPRIYAAVIHLKDNQIIRLQEENDKLNAKTDDMILMTNSKDDDSEESFWNTAAQRTSYIISTSNGRKKSVFVNLIFPRFSANDKYIIGLSKDWTDFYSYEISSNITRNLTKGLPVPLTDNIGKDNYDLPLFKQYREWRFAASLADNEDILLYDDVDIWQIDPGGKRKPINLTNGYGRKNNIVFHLSGIYNGKTITNNQKLVVSAFNKTNKNSGFYRISTGKADDPELLGMGPYKYDPYNAFSVIKARDVDTYLVKRETSSHSPNLFWTKDFNTFISLSAVYPEKGFKWFSSELMHFITLDGRTEQGILYKPENFDPRKKYPVILHYYERKSQDLYKYQSPGEITGGELDIAWFASHGYLVFTPDIHYRIGETGQSSYNSIIAAAKYLTEFHWVDVHKMGLQGHSFGAYETNYIVTQTNLFAAAVSSSGMSDFVSAYNGKEGGQSMYELSQPRMGTTLWERPDSYIKNSPIFFADKVTTPILTIANKLDGNVPFEQGFEWFMALRRLGKKVWMLQYDEETHGVSGKNYIDYVIRMTQFFDHYLKGAPAPKWMTRGIRASMKGIDDGLELDYEIKTPGEGLLIPSEKKKVEALKHRKPITVTFK